MTPILNHLKDGPYGRSIEEQADDDHVFTNGNSNQLWAIDPDGTAHELQNTEGWRDFGIYGDGLLFYDSYGLKLVGTDGSTRRHDLNSGSILSMFASANGTIIVVTTDGVTAIHKPMMSMNMTCLMGLVAFDLLVLLTGSIWLLDHRLKSTKTNP